MNSLELLQIGRSLLSSWFLGVYALDEIPNNLESCGFIVNTQPSVLPGSHWISIIVHKGSCYIFDPLGQPPASHLTSQLHRRGITQIDYNSVQDQNAFTNTCGLHALYFLISNK